MNEYRFKLDFEWTYGDYSFDDSFFNIHEGFSYKAFTYNYFLEAHIIRLIEEYFSIETKNIERKNEILRLILYDNNVEIYIDNVRYIIYSINRLWISNRNNRIYNDNSSKIVNDLRNLKKNINYDNNRFYIKKVEELIEFCVKYRIDIKKLKIEYEVQNDMKYINESMLEILVKKVISNSDIHDLEKFDILNVINNAFLSHDYNRISIIDLALLLFNEHSCEDYIYKFITDERCIISDLLNSIDDSVNDCYDKFNIILNDMQLRVQNKLWRKKYAKNNIGCFATLHINYGKGIEESYYSLSGANDYNGKYNFNINLKEMRDIKDLASKLNKCFFGGKYIYASLSDLTRRYTILLKDISDPIRFISNNGSVKVGDDTEMINSGDRRILGLNFGCCERKLISSIDKYKDLNDISKIFFIKYVPCEKCQQAILDEKGNKEIYAVYNNSSETRMFGNECVLRPEKLLLKERYVLNRC